MTDTKRADFEAWACTTNTGGLWTHLATNKARVFPSENSAKQNAKFHGRTDCKPVRVRVTAEVIE